MAHIMLNNSDGGLSPRFGEQGTIMTTTQLLVGPHTSSPFSGASRLVGNLVVALGLAAIMAGPAHANLVTNPGFEDNNCSLNGWTGGSITTFADAFFPHTGSCSLSFQSIGSDEVVSQSIATTPGEFYEVSLWARLFGFGTPYHLAVSFGGQSVFDLVSSGLNTTYAEFSGVVQASALNSLLTVAGFDNLSALFVDDVSVEPSGVVAVPEPATLALLSLGLAGLGFSRRKH